MTTISSIERHISAPLCGWSACSTAMAAAQAAQITKFAWTAHMDAVVLAKRVKTATDSV